MAYVKLKHRFNNLESILSVLKGQPFVKSARLNSYIRVGDCNDEWNDTRILLRYKDTKKTCFIYVEDSGIWMDGEVTDELVSFFGQYGLVKAFSR